MSHTGSSSEDEEPRDSDGDFDDPDSMCEGYTGKVNVFLLTHTVESLPGSDFLDMHVTQCFNNNLIATVHDTWVHILFFNSTTFRLPALRRDLAAVVPRSKFRIIQKKLEGAKKGEIFWDAERFYSCVDTNDKTTYDAHTIVGTIVQVERFLRRKFDLRKGPNAEKIHMYYLSNGDSKWRVKTFASLKDRRIAITNIILSTKPNNFYCNLEPVRYHQTKKGVPRSNPAIPRGELAPVDKYARVTEMIRITDPTPEENLKEKLKSRITTAELDALVDERYAQRRAALEAEIREQMNTFFNEKMRTTAFQSTAEFEPPNVSPPQTQETATPPDDSCTGKGKSWRSGPTKFKRSLKSQGSGSVPKDVPVKKKLLPTKQPDESIFIGISDSEPSSPELITSQAKKKVGTSRGGTPPQCPNTQPLPQTTEVIPLQPPEVVRSQPPEVVRSQHPEVVRSQAPEVAPWETKIIPGILPILSEKESSDYVSVSGGTSTTTLDEPHLPPERSPVKKKMRTYSSRDPAFQPRVALRDSPGIVGYRTRSKKQSRIEEEQALLASVKAKFRHVGPDTEVTDDASVSTEAPLTQRRDRDPRTL